VKFLPPYSPDRSPIELSGVKNQRDYAFWSCPKFRDSWCRVHQSNQWDYRWKCSQLV
jgi:transposase